MPDTITWVNINIVNPLILSGHKATHNKTLEIEYNAFQYEWMTNRYRGRSKSEAIILDPDRTFPATHLEGLPATGFKETTSMKRPKVFGIGFHKTGTSSLAAALRALGYSVTGPNGTQDPDIAAKLDNLVEDLAARFDAFQDNPWPLVYQKMDKLYPGSKFILTVRDPDLWFNSAIRHFGMAETPMRKLIYGAASPEGHEDIYKNTMLNHNHQVRDYFANRPDDLLEIDITKGEGWDKLCRFLEKPVPDIPFPHANSAEERLAGQPAPTITPV